MLLRRRIYCKISVFMHRHVAEAALKIQENTRKEEFAPLPF